MSNTSNSNLESLPPHEGRDRFMSAFHEAAHVVVGIRLGLLLDSATILPVLIRPEDGEPYIRTGNVEFDGEQQSRWLAEARKGGREGVERMAATKAAGIVAEQDYGGNPDGRATRHDRTSIVVLAAHLGLGNSDENPAVQEFIDAATNRARQELSGEGEEQFMRVVCALVLRDTLTAEQVREVMGDC